MKQHILGGVTVLLFLLPFSLRAEYVYHQQTEAYTNLWQPSPSLTVGRPQPLQALEIPPLQIQVNTPSGMKRGIYPAVYLAHSLTKKQQSITSPFFPYPVSTLRLYAYLSFIYPTHNFW